VARVATVKELAEELGMTVEEILRLRLEMPMDTKSIAIRLNTSRANVAKWRFRALLRLRAEIKE
jgi:DNA-binding transcriptional regulator YiaG